MRAFLPVIAAAAAATPAAALELFSDVLDGGFGAEEQRVQYLGQNGHQMAWFWGRSGNNEKAVVMPKQ